MAQSKSSAVPLRTPTSPSNTSRSRGGLPPILCGCSERNLSHYFVSHRRSGRVRGPLKSRLCIPHHTIPIAAGSSGLKKPGKSAFEHEVRKPLESMTAEEAANIGDPVVRSTMKSSLSSRALCQKRSSPFLQTFLSSKQVTEGVQSEELGSANPSPPLLFRPFPYVLLFLNPTIMPKSLLN